MVTNSDSSQKNNSDLLYSEVGQKEIQAHKSFIYILSLADTTNKVNELDIRVLISNRVLSNEFYYVEITIDIGVDWIINKLCIKLDLKGTPVDYVEYGWII